MTPERKLDMTTDRILAIPEGWSEAREIRETEERKQASRAAREARYDETMPPDVAKHVGAERARLRAAQDQYEAASAEADTARSAYLSGRVEGQPADKLDVLNIAWHQASERQTDAAREIALQSEVVEAIVTRYREARYAEEIAAADKALASAQENYAAAVKRFGPAFRTVTTELSAMRAAIEAERVASLDRLRLDDLGLGSNARLHGEIGRYQRLPALPPAAQTILSEGDGLLRQIGTD